MKNRLFKRAAALFMAGALTLGGLPASSLVSLAAEGTAIEKPTLKLAEAPATGKKPGDVTIEGYDTESKITFKGRNSAQLTATQYTSLGETSFAEDEGHKAFTGYYKLTQPVSGAEDKDEFDIYGTTPFLVTFWTKLDAEAESGTEFNVLGKMNEQYGIQIMKDNAEGQGHVLLYARGNSTLNSGNLWAPQGVSKTTDVTKWNYVAAMYDGDKFWLAIDTEEKLDSIQNADPGKDNHVASTITLLHSDVSEFTVGYNVNQTNKKYPGLISDIKMYRLPDRTTEKDDICENADEAKAYIEETLQKPENLILSTDISVAAPYTSQTTWKEKDIEGAVSTFEGGKTYVMTTVLTANDGFIFNDASKPESVVVGDETVNPTSVVVDSEGKTMTITCEFELESEKCAVSAGYVGGLNLGANLKVTDKESGEEVTEVDPDTEVTFTTTELDGYTFNGWYEDVDGQTAIEGATNLTYTMTISEPTTLYAKYTVAEGKMTVVAEPAGKPDKGGVTITDEDGSEVKSGAAVEQEKKLTLKAEAQEGGRFVQWQDANGKLVTRDPSVEITVKAQMKEGDTYVQTEYWDEQLAAGTLSTQDDSDMWFYQVKNSDDTWKNIESDHFDTDHWGSNGNQTDTVYHWGSIGRSKLGTLCDSANGATYKAIGYAWKAPKAGRVRISLAKPVILHRSGLDTVQFKFSKESEGTESILHSMLLLVQADNTAIDNSDMVAQADVKEGDYIRISADCANNDVNDLEPVITYLESDSAVEYYAQFKDAAAKPVNVARGKDVTLVRGSQNQPEVYPMSYITDGDTSKWADFVNADATEEGAKADAIVQIDLGKEYQNIDRMVLTRYAQDSRTYKGTVIAVSEDENFAEGSYTVIYNCDSTGELHGLGAGTEKTYDEQPVGGVHEITVPEEISARYVRIYMAGKEGGEATDADLAAKSNHIIEFEVFVDSDTTALEAAIGDATAKLEEYKEKPDQYSESYLNTLKQVIDEAQAAVDGQIKEATGDNPSIVVLSETEKADWISRLKKAVDGVKEIGDKYVQTEYWDSEVAKDTMAIQDGSDIWYYQVKDRDQGWINIPEEYFHENEVIYHHEQDTNGNWLSDGNKTYDDFYYAAISRTKITPCLASPANPDEGQYTAMAYAWKAPKDGYVKMYLDTTEHEQMKLGAKGDNQDEPKKDIPFGFTKQSGDAEVEIVAKKTLPAAEFAGIDKTEYSVVIDVKEGDYLRFVAYKADNDIKNLDPVVEYVAFDKAFAQAYLDEHPEADDTYTWATANDFNTKRKALEDALEGDDEAAMQAAYEALVAAYEALAEYTETTTLTITPADVTLTEKGETKELTVAASEEIELKEGGYTWTSDDADTVGVTADAQDSAKATVEAKIEANKTVKITVTATKMDGEFERPLTAEVNVAVRVVLPEIKLDKNEITLSRKAIMVADGYPIGSTDSLIATVESEDELTDWAWTSSDPSVKVTADKSDPKRAAIESASVERQPKDVEVTVSAKFGAETVSAKCAVKVDNWYADVPHDYWGTGSGQEKLETALKNISDGGWVEGYTKEYEDKKARFGPNDSLLRYQFALIVYRMAGKPEVGAGKENPFTDVTEKSVPSAEARNAILWANEAGVIKGYNATTFGPNDTITRAQMMTMMYRYADQVEKVPMQDSDYSDLTQFGDEVKEIQNEEMKKAISWCVGKEVVGGVTVNGETKLAPQGTAPRAQCAIVVSGFANIFQAAE